MKTFIKNTGQKWVVWSVENPKKFFTYSMVFLSLSFLVSILQGILFPYDTTFKIKPPILYSKSPVTQNNQTKNSKEMENIVGELQLLKVKRDRGELLKEDSLRIESLFNQYQNFKNGH
ncbi:hypothetical protein P2W68_01675 [Chryseobacterium arthrosphaerae]|uniref:hypothetical protein n=1 Tax=Chryseobacterium arthrosphaerae TaxID=651561 RepID=UPI0023E2CAE9|nr:hypothetical protein [Chryseobacterium arthrosphaerae]WES98334.1 hypothetical protein P2W68_01675 [Chryseobacterium arthrosphaerae]